jgi:acyl-CoA synthetase (NDP forming)
MDNASMKRIEDILATALEADRDRLHEHEIYELLGLLGFRTPTVRFVQDASGLRGIDLSCFTGGSIVCKLISERMLHRFEHGGIRFAKPAAGELERIFGDFENLAADHDIPLRGMMIAEMIEGNDCIPHQLLLSLRQDASFGPVVFMGLGGVGTEVYKESLKDERALFVRAAGDVPDEEGTERALERTLFYPIVTGRTRISSEPMVKSGKLIEAIETFAALGERFSPISPSPVTIEELEINPLQITSDGEIIPLDAMMKISGSKSETLHPPQSGIGRLLEPETVLIIGASAGKINTGRIILKNIIEGGRIGRDKIHLLHPDADEIDGCRAYPSIDDLPVKADMAVFTIPANERSAGLLEHIIESEKVSAITVISGGFGETENGKELEKRLQDAIRNGRVKNGGGVVLNGPNCLGIVSRPGGYNTFFLPEYKLPFIGSYGERCAFISQSGAYLVTLVSNITKLIHPKYMITFGNQMDLTATDYLIYMKDDPEIDLFVIYLEGFKPYDGVRFLRVAKDIVDSGKKIVMYKTGRTAEGAAAVASHTASMAGNYEVFHRILTDAGVMLPDTLNERDRGRDQDVLAPLRQGDTWQENRHHRQRRFRVLRSRR